MAASGIKGLPTLGFLTVVEHAEWGWTGGLLILNAAGRPLEFHCTAPVKPNRAQEILYGPTLRPFVYGEQIGPTLLGKCRNDMLFLCTDVEPAIGVRDAAQVPVVLVDPSQESSRADASDPAANGPRTWRRDDAHEGPRPAGRSLVPFLLGRFPLAILSAYPNDRELVEQRWQEYRDHLDLQEPFSRIRDALAEAQRGVTK